MERELDYKAIGKRVKIARIKADMKQEHVAEKSGLSPTHISNIETGTTKASLSAIVSVSSLPSGVYVVTVSGGNSAPQSARMVLCQN